MRKYEVMFPAYVLNGEQAPVVDVFEADDMVCDGEYGISFFNAGNLIRRYFVNPFKVIVTPVE